MWTPHPVVYYTSGMVTDPLNLAAFAVAAFMLAALVRFAYTSPVRKESPMHGNLSRESAPVAMHIHNAREVKRLTTPIRESVAMESDDELDFNFVAMDARATRGAAVKRITSATRIEWRFLTDDEIEHIAATCPPTMKERAMNARSKRRALRRRQAARLARGGGK